MHEFGLGYRNAVGCPIRSMCFIRRNHPFLGNWFLYMLSIPIDTVRYNLA